MSKRHSFQFSGQSILNRQENADSARQDDLTLVFTQRVRGRWSGFEIGQLQSNPAQGYDLRGVLGGGVSRYLIEKSPTLLGLDLSVVYNREDVVGDSVADQSGEALLGLRFHRIRHSQHSPTIGLDVYTFSAATRGGPPEAHPPLGRALSSRYRS